MDEGALSSPLTWVITKCHSPSSQPCSLRAFAWMVLLLGSGRGVGVGACGVFVLWGLLVWFSDPPASAVPLRPAWRHSEAGSTAIKIAIKHATVIDPKSNTKKSR